TNSRRMVRPRALAYSRSNFCCAGIENPSRSLLRFWTALVLFVPLSVWVGYACFGNNRLSYKAMALLLVWGVMIHVILRASLNTYIHGFISRTTVVWTQIINAGQLVLVLWLAERWRGGAPIRPV